MSAKYIVALIISLYCVAFVSCGQYQNAVETCKKQYSLSDDAQLDYFMQHGQFKTSEDEKHLQCIFKCITKTLGVTDETSNFDKVKAQKLREENKGEKDLEIFSDPILDYCAAKFAQPSTGCNREQDFVKCAIELGKQQTQ